jgi:hypothetical protein
MVRDTTVDNGTTGISLTGARASARGCYVVNATTGISLGASNTVACDNDVRAATTAFSVGAFATCRVVGNNVSLSTTELSVNASATGLIEHSNNFATISDSATTPHSWLKDRGKVLRITKGTDSTTTPSITPTPQTCDIYVGEMTSAGVMTAITVNATSTTGLVDGQQLAVVLSKTAGTGTPTVTWNGQYVAVGTTLQLGTAACGAMPVMHFVWRSGIAKWVAIVLPPGLVPPNPGITW